MRSGRRPLLGVKRTSHGYRGMSANDLKQTSAKLGWTEVLLK